MGIRNSFYYIHYGPIKLKNGEDYFHSRGKAVFAILPTGAGKSLVCRAELAQAQPRIIQLSLTNIVIRPLVEFIDTPVKTLSQRGIPQ